MSTSSRYEGKDEPIGFDEGILRGLCDMDVSALHCLECRNRARVADRAVCTASSRRPNKAEHRILQGELEAVRHS